MYITLKNSTYFKKIYCYFAVSTIILFTLFTLLVSMFIVMKYSQERKESGLQNLIHATEISENTLNSLTNYAYLLFHNNTTINDILYADSYSSDLSIAFSDLKNDFISYYNIVESIYLINFSADMIFSNVSTCQQIASFYDQDIISLLQSDSISLYHSLYIPRTFVAADGSEKYVITMLFRSNTNHAFVININQAELNNTINHNSNILWSPTLIINEAGMALTDLLHIGFGQEVSDEPWYTAILEASDSSGYFNTYIDNEKYTVLYNKNNSFQFTYVSLLQVSPFGRNNSLFYSTLFIFIPTIIATLLLSLFVTYNMYYPILSLMTTAKKYKGTPRKETDEINYLSETLNSLIDEQQQSQKKHKKLFQQERQTHLRNLLHVQEYYHNLSMDDLSKYNLHFESDNYVVVCFSLDDSIQHLSENHADYELMIYSLQNIASELLSSICQHEHVITAYGEVSYILTISDDKFSDLLPLLEKLQNCMMEYFQKTVSISIGSFCNSTSELYESYQNASNTLRYRFFSGGNCIVNYNTLTQHRTAPTLLMQQEKSIISALQDCQEKLCVQRMEAYFEALQNIPIDSIVINILSFHESLGNAEEESGITVSSHNFSINYFFESYSFQEIHKKFVQRMNEDLIQLREIKQNGNIKPQLISTVLAYVDENLFSTDFTVESIANHIHLSTNYLRSIFKEYMGVSLSKYITNQKIQHACKLLIETDESIQTISDKLDFSSINYFYPYFKKHTGMTPSQYREVHKNNT